MNKKVIRTFASVVIVVMSVLGLMSCGESVQEYSLDELYQMAMVDSMLAEASEIETLVEIESGSEDVLFDDSGRALMLSWHKYPDSYQDGEIVNLMWGEIWTFTSVEFENWYQENSDGVDDWTLRLEQLIGLPYDSGYTHISGFWVNVEDMVRPCYETEITEQLEESELNFNEFGADFQEWFSDNIVSSYYDGAYPWTRLGYTYDWANNGIEYGLSEFLVNYGSDVEVKFTLSTEDFLSTLD